MRSSGRKRSGVEASLLKVAQMDQANSGGGSSITLNVRVCGSFPSCNPPSTAVITAKPRRK